MVSKQPDELIDEVEEHKVSIREEAKDAVEFFMKNEGELFNANELHGLLDVDDGMVGDIVAHLVSDDPDPVQMIRTKTDRYVGVIEYWEGEGVYAFEGYDDIDGRVKTAVCSRCVHEGKKASDVGRVSEKDVNGNNVGYDVLEEILHESHYSKHDVNPKEVSIKLGASLASGTTINSSTAIHGGNQSSFGAQAFSGSAGNSGEFLKTDGNSLSFDTAVGDDSWTEDGNSPWDPADSQTLTYNLSSNWDLIKLHVELFKNVSGGSQLIQFFINGDSGNGNYNYTVANGNNYSDAAVAYIIGDSTFPDGHGFHGLIFMNGRWGTGWCGKAVGALTSRYYETLDVFNNPNAISPLDSFTFKGGSGNISVRLRVFGIDI
jgi:hypothetical protein